MIKRGLVIGRFQPPHLGHLGVIKEVLNQQDEVIIVVAASQLSHTKKNPLTAGERITLIRLMLDAETIDPAKYWFLNSIFFIVIILLPKCYLKKQDLR